MQNGIHVMVCGTSRVQARGASGQKYCRFSEFQTRLVMMDGVGASPQVS